MLEPPEEMHHGTTSDGSLSETFKSRLAAASSKYDLFISMLRFFFILSGSVVYHMIKLTGLNCSSSMHSLRILRFMLQIQRFSVENYKRS